MIDGCNERCISSKNISNVNILKRRILVRITDLDPLAIAVGVM
jgi:hypothetical protein